MSRDTIFSCIGIFCGVIIMLVSIIKARSIMHVLPLVPKLDRHKIKQFLRLHIFFNGFFSVKLYCGFGGICLWFSINKQNLSKCNIPVWGYLCIYRNSHSIQTFIGDTVNITGASTDLCVV